MKRSMTLASGLHVDNVENLAPEQEYALLALPFSCWQDMGRGNEALELAAAQERHAGSGYFEELNPHTGGEG